VDIVTEDWKRRGFQQDLSLSAPAGETTPSPDFLYAHTTRGGFLQSPSTIPVPR